MPGSPSPNVSAYATAGLTRGERDHRGPQLLGAGQRHAAADLGDQPDDVRVGRGVVQRPRPPTAGSAAAGPGASASGSVGTTSGGASVRSSSTHTRFRTPQP